MADLVDEHRWQQWLRSRRGQRCLARWSERFPSFEGWTVETLGAPQWSEATDRMQHDLVVLAQEGDGDAAITVLVQLRPGLLRLARSRARVVGESWPETCDEVRAVFNETLYRHRLDRRPNRIAANLILDTRQRLYRGVTPRSPVTPPPGAASWRAGPGLRPGPGPEVVDSAWMLRRAIDRLPGSSRSRAITAEAAYRRWILDQPRSEVAGALGLRPAALDTRLHRLRRVVRQELEQAA